VKGWLQRCAIPQAVVTNQINPLDTHQLQSEKR
jgi:hypothetical protein